jgi:hypothetical protein
MVSARSSILTLRDRAAVIDFAIQVRGHGDAVFACGDDRQPEPPACFRLKGDDDALWFRNGVVYSDCAYEAEASA